MSVLRARRRPLPGPAPRLRRGLLRPGPRRRRRGTPRSGCSARLRDAAALGVAVGAALAREHGARAVLVCSWGAPARRPGPTMPATAAARGLARSLVARGLDAAASGRLVLVAVEDAAAAGRALAVAPGPTVLVVAAARDAAMDAVLRAQDHVLVADTGEEGVAALAEARLAADGVRTARCAVPTGLARRAAGPRHARAGRPARRARAGDDPRAGAAARRRHRGRGARRGGARRRCRRRARPCGGPRGARRRASDARRVRSALRAGDARRSREPAAPRARRVPRGRPDCRARDRPAQRLRGRPGGVPGRGLDGARAHPCDGPRSDPRG